MSSARQRAYWDVFARALFDLVKILAGRGIPSVPWLGAKYQSLYERIKENLERALVA